MSYEDREKQSDYSGSYSYGYRKRRAKSDWAGMNLGDAFKTNLDYYQRLPAQRLFYRMMAETQKAAAQLAGAAVTSRFEPKVKPQLGPCYTTYPATLSAYAAIGLSAFLEFEAQSSSNLLITKMGKYLVDPVHYDRVPVDSATYRSVAQLAAHAVQTRLLIEDLSRVDAMSPVEIYRLFAASQQDLNFSSLPRIIRAVVLYGDLLPDWSDIELHPMTKSLLDDLTRCSSTFFEKLASIPSHELLKFGIAWTRTLCQKLAKYLPEPQVDEKVLPFEHLPLPTDLKRTPENAHFTFGNTAKEAPRDDVVPPLKQPKPPALLEEQGGQDQAKAKSQLQRSVNQVINDFLKSCLAGTEPSHAETIQGRESERSGEHSKPESAQDRARIVQNFQEIVSAAGGQQDQWEDMRSDLVERILTISDFAQGPIEGDPAQGHQVNVQYGNLKAGGEIFDRPETLSEDLPACEKLLHTARPITEQLRRTLYPNIEPVPEVQRFCTSGCIDPGKLPIAGFEAAIWKRHRMVRKPDKRGRPILVIACDGSGSLDSLQMKMLKVLCAAWLAATSRTGIEVLAGLYHSGTIRNGVAGPLVRWIYHPEKTPATSRIDAARALVSLPDSGTGIQSDALSLVFIMNEATRIARGKAIYAIVITDCQWNRSFNTAKSGKEEVLSFFADTRTQLKDRLHTTLVALGTSGETGMEGSVDKVIPVPAADLTDFASVAGRVGGYVASCIRERKKLIKG